MLFVDIFVKYYSHLLCDDTWVKKVMPFGNNSGGDVIGDIRWVTCSDFCGRMFSSLHLIVVVLITYMFPTISKSMFLLALIQYRTSSHFKMKKLNYKLKFKLEDCGIRACKELCQPWRWSYITSGQLTTELGETLTTRVHGFTSCTVTHIRTTNEGNVTPA